MQTLARYAPVGAVVYCAYWQYVYQVVDHCDDGSIKVQMLDHPRNHPMWSDGTSAHHRVGSVWTHHTALDWRDEIIHF